MIMIYEANDVFVKYQTNFEAPSMGAIWSGLFSGNGRRDYWFWFGADERRMASGGMVKYGFVPIKFWYSLSQLN